MDLISIVLIAIGVSMDAFAVAIGKGLNMKKIDYKWSLTIALFFGVFQALMPLIGWFLGGQFSNYINGYDHWIALILLAIIGGKMIYESRDKDCEMKCKQNNLKELVVLSIATSIDALAVGLAFAIMDIDIYLSSLVIGIITFSLSFVGVIIGNKVGCKFKSSAEVFGGVILIFIGFKIFVEHVIV